MKKVVIANGGYPAIGDYTLQLQDALADTAKGIVSGEGDHILSGCVLTNTGGTDYSISEGYIAWGGEVMHVPAHVISNPTALPIVVYKITSTIANTKQYDDALLKDLAVITEAKFKPAAAPVAGEALLSDFNNQWRIIPEHGTTETDKLTSADLTSVHVATDPFKYRLRNNCIDITGIIYGKFVPTPGDEMLVAVLKGINLDPAKIYRFYCADYNSGGGREQIPVFLFGDGSLWINCYRANGATIFNPAVNQYLSFCITIPL